MAGATSALTPEGIEVQEGQVWKDLDSRSSRRFVRVMGVHEGAAIVQQCTGEGSLFGSRSTRIAVRRMVKSSTGYALYRQVSGDTA